MEATVKNLKENRDEVIKTLVELFGEENLKTNMKSLLNMVECAERFRTHNTIEECIKELEELSQTSRRKTSKTAEMIAEMAFNRGEVWDKNLQKFVKF